MDYAMYNGAGDALFPYKHTGRKRMALCLQQGGITYTLAYFLNPEEVERFNQFLTSFVGTALWYPTILEA